MNHITYQVKCDNCESLLEVVGHEVNDTRKIGEDGGIDDTIRIDLVVERCSCEDGNIRAEIRRKERR